MKTAIHLPKPDDFYETSVIDVSLLDGRRGLPNETELKSLYKKAKINLMNIVDITEFENVIEYMTDADCDEYEKACKEWHEQNGNRHIVGEMPPHITNNAGKQHPQPKTQKKTIKGTVVLYHNTSMRIIADEIEEFWEKYAAYLKVKALDFSGE